MESIRNRIVCSLQESAELKLRLIDSCLEGILRATDVIARGLKKGNKLLLFGNGGSAADAQHMAAEFVGRFSRDRNPLPAMALTTDTSALTAIGNDYGFDQIFARQVKAIGRKGDVALAISTSGRSQNVLAAVEMARKQEITTIGLAGGDGGALKDLVDIFIIVPSFSTARIQECHLAIEHLICEGIELTLWNTQTAGTN